MGLTLGVAVAAGVVATVVARLLRIPGIVVLLATGVVLGPELAGIVQPNTLGDGLQTLVGLAVAVILFDGGLNLNLERLRREALVIRRLVTVGAVITGALATLAVKVSMGWDWSLSALFGTLVIVTGPTVITPLLRRIKVNQNVSTVLEAEGVLIDPIGAIIAVVALEVVIALHGGSESVLGYAGVLVSRLGFGVVAGAAGGVAIGLVLRRRRLVPEGLENIFTLGLVLALFAGSNEIQHESGIMSVTVAGLVVGNMNTHIGRDLLEFKEQLTVMLIGLLFVLLAADVAIADVVALGWPGIITVLLLMFVVRPINVVASTTGSNLNTRERLFLCWLAPRGIVAAAVAALFAQELTAEGMTGGTALQALVFLVIASTVVIQGLPGGFIAGLLGVRRKANHGFVIVGANPLGRALGQALRNAGEDPVLVDLNPAAASAAESDGFKVVFGNAHEESVLVRAGIDTRRGFIAVTPSEGVNLILTRRAREEFKVHDTHSTLLRGRPGVQERQVHETGASVLFGEPVDMELWSHRLNRGAATIEVWRYEGEARLRVGDAQVPEHSIVHLCVTRGNITDPVDDVTRYRAGDVVRFLVYRDVHEQIATWLLQTGWVSE